MKHTLRVLYCDCNIYSHTVRNLNPNYGNNYHNSEPYWQLPVCQKLGSLYGSRGLANMDPDYGSRGRKSTIHTPDIGTGMEMTKRKSRV